MTMQTDWPGMHLHRPRHATSECSVLQTPLLQCWRRLIVNFIPRGQKRVGEGVFAGSC